ncbi:hypothetical protein EJ06DRAFT_505621 [Trichodelitschia bisporula]|uniref:Uncharacterized protein n=1 Tax=Trichodelitschia bisporula TaxID=703511 RepID=A0A6G1I3C7_9PEZI|nr:hypothetical protein EJ06DRAFT_505621 [Trichodelitschia bisporula]
MALQLEPKHITPPSTTIGATPPLTPPVEAASISILSPDLITTSSTALRFHAAAALQLTPLLTPTISSFFQLPTTVHRLITSPYNTPFHTQDLTPLPRASALLSLALTTLTPTRADYATAPYLESFNWPAVLALLRDLCTATQHVWTNTTFYTVIFRSTLKHKGAAYRTRLGELDEGSHVEAVASGGLLKYWFGDTDGERRNLATCIWHSRADAHRGGKGPGHARARRAAGEFYEGFEFSTWRLVVEDGTRGVRLEEWIEGEEGR